MKTQQSDRDIKRLIVVAGVFGAGKSTFINRVLQPFYQEQLFYLLPDNIKLALYVDMNIPDFHHQVIDPMIRQHLNNQVSLLYETTLTSLQDRKELPGDAVGLGDYLDQVPSDLDRLRLAREWGYNEILLFYLGLESPQMHHQRIIERHQKEGRQLIAYPYTVNRFRKSWRNLPAASRLADRTYVINNSNKDFAVVAKLEQGQVVYQRQLSSLFAAALAACPHGEPAPLTAEQRRLEMKLGLDL